LVVDDVQTNLDVARGMLKPYGMIVDCVDSGKEAVGIIREGSLEESKRYNAIFMDHMMPGMDGIEAVRIIRNEIGTEYAKTIPIIALTANAIIGNEDLFLKSGFQAFLSKPIDIIRLDTIINRYVRNKNLETEPAIPEKVPVSSAGDADGKQGPSLFRGKAAAGVDFTIGLSRFGNNEETYLGILDSYLSQIRAASGKIAACAAEPSAENLADYRIIAHSLKSASYTIGADAIGKLAEELEHAADDLLTNNSDDGKHAFISARSGELVESLEKLGENLAGFLEKTKIVNKKPVQSAPDPALLAKVLAACRQYDMGQLDAAMEELERYDYESQADLIAWLREQVDKSELEKIQERLSKPPAA
jgi:CheY-like chemotaxis protein